MLLIKKVVKLVLRVGNYVTKLETYLILVLDRALGFRLRIELGLQLFLGTFPQSLGYELAGLLALVAGEAFSFNAAFTI